MTRLDIISDVVCPWCYIGTANLARALAAHDPHPFALHWRPYQLNPDTPPEGTDRRAYLTAKFGPARIAEMDARLAEAAKTAGVPLDLSRATRIPNTLDAHRLIRWAEAEARQTQVAGALFHRYFVEGEDISDHAVLAAAAAEAGMDALAVARLLESPTDREEVRAEAEAAREMGVTGVPTFIVGGKYAVSGAQPVEMWEKLIAELAAAG